MSGLYRNNPQTPEGKYLVKRRDGTKPEWPFFVLGGRDPAAIRALGAYADAAEDLGYDPEYVRDVRRLAADFSRYLGKHGSGDPDAPPDENRVEDPETVAEMRGSLGA